MSSRFHESRVRRLCSLARSFSVSNIAEKILYLALCRQVSLSLHAISHIQARTHVRAHRVCMFMYPHLCTLIPFISYSLLVQSCCLLRPWIPTKPHSFFLNVASYFVFTCFCQSFPNRDKSCPRDLLKSCQAKRQEGVRKRGAKYNKGIRAVCSTHCDLNKKPPIFMKDQSALRSDVKNFWVQQRFSWKSDCRITNSIWNCITYNGAKSVFILHVQWSLWFVLQSHALYLNNSFPRGF